jgi:hypothetical protein
LAWASGSFCWGYIFFISFWEEWRFLNSLRTDFFWRFSFAGSSFYPILFRRQQWSPSKTSDFKWMELSPLHKMCTMTTTYIGVDQVNPYAPIYCPRTPSELNCI